MRTFCSPYAPCFACSDGEFPGRVACACLLFVRLFFVLVLLRRPIPMRVFLVALAISHARCVCPVARVLWRTCVAYIRLVPSLRGSQRASAASCVCFGCAYVILCVPVRAMCALVWCCWRSSRMRPACHFAACSAFSLNDSSVRSVLPRCAPCFSSCALASDCT